MANEWMEGTGADALEGGDLASTIDDKTTASLQDPLDRVLSNYRRGCCVEYASASTVTISVGELVLNNTAGTVNKMRKITTAITLSITTNLDTGSEAVSTLYYVYGTADADAETFLGIISTSSSFPTGYTYARRLGSFYNDASGNIIANTVDNDYKIPARTWVDKSSSYGAQIAYCNGRVYARVTYVSGNDIDIRGYTDSNASPTTIRIREFIPYASASSGMIIPIVFDVSAGDYWKVTVNTGTPTVYFYSTGE